MFLASSLLVVNHSTPQTMNSTMVGHIDREVYRPFFPFPIIRPRIDNYTGWDGDRDKAVAAKAVSEYGVALEVYIDMRIPRDQLHRPQLYLPQVHLLQPCICWHPSITKAWIELTRRNPTTNSIRISTETGIYKDERVMRSVFPITPHGNSDSKSGHGSHSSIKTSWRCFM